MANERGSMPEEWKRKISEANKKVKHTDEWNDKVSKSKQGEKHHLWKGGRIEHCGYIYSYCPTHPHKAKGAYVMEHRLVMERHIGRHLLPTETVHHINGDKSDNRIENLSLFTSKSEHQKFHHPKGTIKGGRKRK